MMVAVAYFHGDELSISMDQTLPMQWYMCTANPPMPVK
jgi:hypothetical protein